NSVGQLGQFFFQAKIRGHGLLTPPPAHGRAGAARRSESRGLGRWEEAEGKIRALDGESCYARCPGPQHTHCPQRGVLSSTLNSLANRAKSSSQGRTRALPAGCNLVAVGCRKRTGILEPIIGKIKLPLSLSARGSKRVDCHSGI